MRAGMVKDSLLDEVVDYLDAYLGIAELPDEPGALNGLQVGNSGRVSVDRGRR